MTDLELLNHLLDEIQETLNDFEQRTLRLEGNFQLEEMKTLFRAAHNIKGGGYLFGMNEFGAFVHTVEEMLSILLDKSEPLKPETVDLLLGWHQATVQWVGALRKNPKAVLDFSALRGRIVSHVELIRGTMPAPSETVPTSEALSEEKAPEPSAATPSVAQAEPISSKQNPEQQNDTEARKVDVATLRRKKASGTLRIASSKIDNIMQIIGELSIHQSILMHGQLNGTLDSAICRNSVLLNQKTLRGLHELVLSLRMQPIENLFQRVERTARDLAREQNKQIDITVVGSDTLLDKTVIEMMIDPMIHLVRNAIDHGIEDGASRVSDGKPAQARLMMEATQDAGQVVITMTDDGRGIDSAKVAAKAVSKGLIPPNHELSEAEILQLIYLPGFSTRDVANAISGRGVGMDVVREAIQRIGGRIDLSTKKGKGTCFQISLPTSLEIIEGMVVRLGSETYIAPLQDILEVVDLRTLTVEKFGKSGWATRLRDMLVPIEDLSDYLRVGARNKEPHSTRNIGLVVRLNDGGRLALRVDQILSQQQVVVRPMSDHLSRVPGFTGVTILGNGEPALILNIFAIAESYLQWTGQTRRAA